MSMGLGSIGNFCKRKFRWSFSVAGVSGASGVLPPSKSARPSLSFREMEIKHLTETIYYPARPEWKPISLVLYDTATGRSPVFEWIQQAYDPQSGSWSPVSNLLSEAKLDLYDGCGTIIETWIYEDAWPQVAEFGELDMSSSEIVTCDLTLRYARAYVQ